MMPPMQSPAQLQNPPQAQPAALPPQANVGPPQIHQLPPNMGVIPFQPPMQPPVQPPMQMPTRTANPGIMPMQGRPIQQMPPQQNIFANRAMGY